MFFGPLIGGFGSWVLEDDEGDDPDSPGYDEETPL
jgi:hypothetical protein